MTRAPSRRSATKAGGLVRLLAAASLLAPALAVALPAAAQAAPVGWAGARAPVRAALPVTATASDDFNRADGPLGPNWTDISGGGLAIASHQAAGTSGSGLTGDVWTASSYTGNQFSQISLTGAQLTGGQWVGAAVRSSTDGQNAYAGIYFWNNGSPELMLFVRTSGNWTQLGSSYASGALPAGTVLKVTAVGSSVALLENGVQRIAVTDSTLSGGSPGIMVFGTGAAANWSGGEQSNITYTVGGTVSGLSGTVVLQDNGGDSLSVSASGAFTFATSLASGAPYAVTVATYPADQVCTVTAGTGVIAAASIKNVAVKCVTGKPATSATDNFNRADGPLGPTWTATGDGPMTITGDVAAGSAGSGLTGATWTAGEFSTDQFSQFQTTAAALSGAEWIGASVRVSNAGQDGYAGIYYWNNGSPELELFERSAGNWTQLGDAYDSGTLPAGTTLRLSAVGDTVALLENGTSRISVTDTSFTGGAPGLMAFGTGQADNWSGGDEAGGSGGAGPAIYTVGGTVAGLAGTVVLALADNGSDLRSVTANGKFTFGAKLPAGATYHVTVATYPTGQICTVARGSGTISKASISNVAVSCVKGRPVAAITDAFNRANGGLGPLWTGIRDGSLEISGDGVAGTTSGLSGDVRSGEVFAGDQYSQIEVGARQLTGTQWIGAAIRLQDSGMSGYAGIYFWNSGSPELILFRRNNGAWTNLGTYASSPLPAGTTLRLEAAGTTIAFLEDGVQRIAVGDTTLSGGSPGIMINGTARADAWSGGTQGFAVDFVGADASGVKTYDVISASNSGGPQALRVLAPTHPRAGVKHNFLFALPVQPGLSDQFGDGLQALAALDAQDQYNVTIIAPSFGIDPWYANSPVNAGVQYETYMTSELVPWVKRNLSQTGLEQNWLLGFSKSGIGAQDLILKHPTLFTLAASWDLPADMASDTEFGSDSEAGYGTDANYQQNYELSRAFVAARRLPFLNSTRIWVGGFGLYQTDDADYEALLTSLGVRHGAETPTPMAHTWDSGWVPLALAALYSDSLHIRGVAPPCGPGLRCVGR